MGPAEGGQAMPIIDVKVMEGVLTTEQKQKIARGMTDVFADVVGSRARPVTWVVIQDVASGQWTMGGGPLRPKASRSSCAASPPTFSPKFPPSRLVDAFDQVAEPLITEITSLRSHELSLFHLVSAYIGSAPGGTTG
jgi:4-oxalocrotonate tautomerase